MPITLEKMEAEYLTYVGDDFLLPLYNLHQILLTPDENEYEQGMSDLFDMKQQLTKTVHVGFLTDQIVRLIFKYKEELRELKRTPTSICNKLELHRGAFFKRLNDEDMHKEVMREYLVDPSKAIEYVWLKEKVMKRVINDRDASNKDKINAANSLARPAEVMIAPKQINIHAENINNVDASTDKKVGFDFSKLLGQGDDEAVDALKDAEDYIEGEFEEISEVVPDEKTTP